MNEPVSAPTAVAAGPSDPIPYRDAPGVGGGDAFASLGGAVVLLVLACAVLLWIRRKGWLARWTVAAPLPARSARQLVAQESLRLSGATVVHRIADGDRHYIVVESTRHIEVRPAQPAKEHTDA